MFQNRERRPWGLTSGSPMDTNGDQDGGRKAEPCSRESCYHIQGHGCKLPLFAPAMMKTLIYRKFFLWSQRLLQRFYCICVNNRRIPVFVLVKYLYWYQNRYINIFNIALLSSARNINNINAVPFLLHTRNLGCTNCHASSFSRQHGSFRSHVRFFYGTLRDDVRNWFEDFQWIVALAKWSDELSLNIAISHSKPLYIVGMALEASVSRLAMNWWLLFKVHLKEQKIL